ncbi:hypothetical protein HQ535_08680 [bacterium]|nr:hypothetical protein [bacterium]
MHRRTIVATGLGAALGAFGGLAVLALSASRIITTGIDAVLLDAAASRARSVFVITEGGLTLLVVAAGAIAGAALAAIGYLVAKEVAPDEPLFRVGPMMGIGAAAGVIVSYAIARIGLGLSASIDGGVVTLSVFRGTVLALLVGAVTGGVVSGAIERLSSPELFKIEGQAVAAGPVDLMRRGVVAVGIPVLAVLLGAGVVAGLGYVLLEAPHQVSIILFGGLAAVLLGLATLIAANPPRRDRDDE